MMKKPKRPQNSIPINLTILSALFRYLFDKIFNTYISIKIKSNMLSGRYFNDRHFGIPNSFNYSNRLKINDIKNKKLRYSLYLTSLFKPWYIYEKNDENNTSELTSRQGIYISRNKLEIGDKVIGERISKVENKLLLNNKYRKQRRKLGVLSIKDYYKIEPQFYVLYAKYTTLHEKLNKYGTDKYNYKKEKELKKAVNEAINTSNFNTRRSFTGKHLGASLVEHLLYDKNYDYLHKIYDSLDELDKEKFKSILETYVYEENINDERKDYIKQFN